MKPASALSFFAAPCGSWRSAQVLCLALCVFLGCGKSNVGVFSQSDYSYSADTPEEAAKARTRFENAVKFFESEGLRTVSLNRAEKQSEAVQKTEGTEVRITLLFAENGFATITLSYSFQGTDIKSKAQAESVLARAQQLLAPEQPARAS